MSVSVVGNGREGYGERDVERLVPEAPKRLGRTAFERDRARVVHSAALRRLAAKTQVVGPGTDDFVRNRLTHSLEVAQVGRELAIALRCDPDVVDAACLAHDLGHPPFGHNGETVLDEVAARCGGFEGNAQTLRTLTRLEAKALDPRTGLSAGLNLTRASLDAATKYPWLRGHAPASDADGSPAKFGVYESDAAVFRWLRQDAPEGRRCLEAQVMDFSDDVAYSVHDVEDAIVSGRFDPAALGSADERGRVVAITQEWYLPKTDPARLASALEDLRSLPFWVGHYDGSRPASAALKDMTSQLIGRFCAETERATHAAYGLDGPLTRYRADLVVPEEVRAETAVLKGIAALYVMTAEDRQPIYLRQRELLLELVEALAHGAPGVLEPAFRFDWDEASGDDDRLRVLVDQVASLTDVSAVEWHGRLVGRRGGVPDPA